MKKTALSVGAVTLLGQGIGLAAGSSGGGLRWLHVSDKRTSSVGRTVTVPYQDPDDIPALYAEALWGMLGNNTEQHEIGRPEEYESTNEVKISTSGAISGQTNGNNTYIAVGTAVAGGPPRRSVREELPHTALALSRARKRCSG